MLRGLASGHRRHGSPGSTRHGAGLFLLSGHDDGAGVFANMGLPPDGRKPFFAFSTAVIVIDSLLGGAALALALGTGLDLSLGPAAGVGGAAAVVSVVGWIRYADRRLDASAGDTQPMFPSPSPSDSDALRSWKSDG
jgi:hypothetical protein